MATLIQAAGLLLATDLAFKAIAAAIAVIAGLGAGISMGLATGKAVEATARQPEAAGMIRSTLIMGLVFAETTALYGLIISLIIIFVL